MADKKYLRLVGQEGVFQDISTGIVLRNDEVVAVDRVSQNMQQRIANGGIEMVGKAEYDEFQKKYKQRLQENERRNAEKPDTNQDKLAKSLDKLGKTLDKIAGGGEAKPAKEAAGAKEPDDGGGQEPGGESGGQNKKQ